MAFSGEIWPGNGAAGNPAGRRVVLVDDAPDVRKTICEVLNMAGYTVAAYGSGEDVLADDDGVAGAAVLIADILLGGELDGIAVAEALKRRNDSLKVIYITGYFGSTRLLKLRSQDRFLHKPFGIAELLNAMNELTRPAVD